MRSKSMKCDAKSLGLGLLMVLALVAANFLVISLAAGSAMTWAQTGQSGSSEKPKASSPSADKPASAKSASTSSASTSSESAAPASKTPSSKTQTSSAAAKPEKRMESATGMVWVNIASGVYHKPGSRWYGKTKRGKYMLEQDAMKAGYKPARN